MKQTKKTWKLLIALISAFYIAIRFWNLTHSCLWFDEIFSIHAAEHSWGSFFGFIAQDLIHPPFFYILLKIWITVGGETLFWLRFFPVLFSIIALLPFFFLCKQLKLKFPTIAFALIFLAVNGSLIKYAQEVRMYSLLLCLSLFSLWLFARFLNVGKGIWFLTFVNILLVHTQYFGWFLVIAEVLAVLYLQRIKILQTLTMFGLVLVSYVPWFIAIFQASKINADVSQNLGWASKPNLPTLIRFLFNLNEPFYFQTSNVDAVSNWIITVPLLLIIFIALGFYFAVWNKQTEKEKNVFYFILIFIFAPFLSAFPASWILPFSIWGTRDLIIIFPVYAVFLAIAFEKIPIKYIKIVLISAFLLLYFAAFALQIRRGTQNLNWCAWENFAAQVSPVNPNGKTEVYVFEDLVAYQFWFALRDNKNFQIVKVENIPKIAEDRAYFLPRGFETVKKIKVNEINTDNFYIAFNEKEWNYLKQPLRTFIEKGYKISEPKIFEAQGLKAFLVEIKK